MRVADLPLPRTSTYLVVSGLLFIFALSIPTVVSVTSLLLILVTLSGGFLGGINIAYFWRLFLLTLFAALYFAVLILHHYSGLLDFIKLPMIFAGLYATGYTFARGKTPRDANRTAWLLLAPAMGFVAFAMGSVIYSGFPLKSTFLLGANSLWQEGSLHKTLIGVFSSFGMCLLPAVFVVERQSSERRLWTAICLAAVLAGFAANFAVQNRTPLISMGVATFFGGWIVLRDRIKNGFDLKRLVQWASLSFLLIGTLVSALIYYFPLLMDTVFLRFRVMGGLQSTRFQVWATMLEHPFDYPFGGRRILLVENFAHNVWLDAVFDVGLPIALLLLVFHLSHISALTNCIRNLPFLRLRVTVAVLGTSLATSFLVEPIMSASPYVFAVSCFVLGVVLRLSHEIDGVETFSSASAGNQRLTKHAARFT